MQEHGGARDEEKQPCQGSMQIEGPEVKPYNFNKAISSKHPGASGRGVLALLGVALLWGTYAPSFKFLFLLDKAPSPALALAVQSTLCSLFLLTTVIFGDSDKDASSASKDHEDDDDSDISQQHQSSLLLSKAPAPAPPAKHTKAVQARDRIQQYLQFTSPRLSIAGLELGCWSFLGNALASMGLSLTTATKAGFLMQVTGFMVPMLSYLGGEVIGGIIWLSCGLGALGSALVTVDSARAEAAAATVTAATAGWPAGPPAAAAAPPPPGAALQAAATDTLLGQWLTLAACLFFALNTVRIGMYSKKFRGPELAFAAQASAAAFALLWLAFDVCTAQQGVAAEVRHIMLLFRNHTAVSVMLWIGLGPGAVASLLQVWGQKLVPASQAQVIFSSTPLWAGIIAQSVLKGEVMGVQGWFGSSIIVVATLIAAFADVVGSAGGSSSSAGKEKVEQGGGKDLEL